MKIKATYEHSKFGTFMFNLCAKWTKFILKHKVLFYILACTWGIILTALGTLISIGLFIAMLFNGNIVLFTYNWIYGFKVGPDWWGGAEMGLMFFRDHKSSSIYIDSHEFGHTIQNTLLGPLTPFLVAIPSATRYWYQVIRENKGLSNKPYDSVWFEDSATQCGFYADWYLKKVKEEKLAKKNKGE